MNSNQSAFRFFPLFPGNQTVKVKHTLKQLTFYFQKPRRLRNSKLYEWEWRLYQTSVHLIVLYQIFRATWWMWNTLSERRGWSAKVMNGWQSGRRGWVRDGVDLCEREGANLCVREGERVDTNEWGVNFFFLKTPIWNRVSKTRFPCGSTTSQPGQISTWTPDGNWVLETRFPGRPPARSDLNKTCKPRLKDSIYGSKIESLRLKMLLRNILCEPDLLTKWLGNYG